MRGRADSLYRRLGPRRYYNAYVAFDTAGGSLVFPLGGAGLLALFLELSITQFLLLYVVALIGTATAVSAGSLLARRVGETIFAWAEAGRPADGAPAAWRAAVRLQRTQIRNTTSLGFALGVVPVVAALTTIADLRPYEVAIVLAFGVALMGYAHVTHYFGVEPALRPIFEDVSERLPSSFEERARLSLRWRMLAALLLINVQAVVAVGILVARSDASLAAAGWGVVAAVVGYFGVSLALTLLVARGVLNPIRDLDAAMSRITAGDLTTRVPVTAGDEFGSLQSRFNQMMDGLNEREALREAFGSYVAPVAAGRILEEGGALSGDEVEATIMFLDIRGFTAFAEGREAAEVVAFLNDFFGLVVPVITAHGGYANRIMGDGLLSVFGAPESLADHAPRALAAAREIAATVEQSYGDSLRIGIGLNSGPVIAGTISGGPKREYTLTGDVVNVASRVEGLTKDTGDTILLTAATRELAGDEARDAAERGEIDLRGKSEPVTVYALEVGPHGSRVGLGTEETSP